MTRRAAAALVVLAAACGGNAADGVPAGDDLGDTMECTVEFEVLRAEGAVTNPTDAPVDYRLIVVWETLGTQIARNSVLLEDVGPGVRRAFEVTSRGSGDARTICRVDRIERLIR